MNMSQDRFGKKLGISGKTVSAYERGTCIPPLKILEKASLVYGFTFVHTAKENSTNLSDKFAKMKILLEEVEKHLL